MLIRRPIHEVSGILIVAECSAGVTLVVRASEQNDPPDGDNTLYTKHVILWQGHLADYTTLGIWWVFKTESEVNCGLIAWTVTKSRQDDRQQYTFEGRHPMKKIVKVKHRIKKKATSWLTVIVHLGIGLCCATIWECAVGDKNKRSTNGHIMNAMVHPCLHLVRIGTEWGIFRRQVVCANAGYLLSNPSTGGVRRRGLLLQ